MAQVTFFANDGNQLSRAQAFVDRIRKEGGVATNLRSFLGHGEHAGNNLVTTFYIEAKDLSFNDPICIDWVHMLHRGTREEITRFLQEDDRNGCYTDSNCDIEGLPRMTYQDCAEMLVRGLCQMYGKPETYDLEKMVLELPVEVFEVLAHEASCVDDDDYGSDRQVTAENYLNERVVQCLDPLQQDEYETYGLKATTEETIAYARQLLFGKEVETDV